MLKKDLVYLSKESANQEIKNERKFAEGFLDKGVDQYMERYSAQIMETLHKNSKLEQMQFVKIKATENFDLKAKMLTEYTDP